MSAFVWLSVDLPKWSMKIFASHEDSLAKALVVYSGVIPEAQARERYIAGTETLNLPGPKSSVIEIPQELFSALEHEIQSDPLIRELTKAAMDA